jgi:chorismate mutase
LLGARELAVDGGLPRCVRVLVHCYSARSRKEVLHVYLEDARSLRTDLPE